MRWSAGSSEFGEGLADGDLYGDLYGDPYGVAEVVGAVEARRAGGRVLAESVSGVATAVAW
ncbi:hypothetical protein ACGF12_02865 [Kitasatospora sp. NPDC048296]|uniref:hypothetical protein n=1 Tax=Kitasatospora sp. NPDC048296 TaxID=3364048 RepID=UPI00371EB5D0